MTNRSDMLRQRWSDPDYRTRQTESNRNAARAQSIALADPLKRKLHGQAVRVGKRLRKQWRKQLCIS